jgi:two-component system capsular synthesis sensor histidine kinase RcsC
MVKPMTLQKIWTELVEVCEVDLCGVAQVLSETGQGCADDPTQEPIVVSARMRDLFINTMSTDIRTAAEALISHDIDALKARLHCIRGALAVVQAHDLANGCGELEQRLESHVLDASLLVQIEALLARIRCAVAAI